MNPEHADEKVRPAEALARAEELNGLGEPTRYCSQVLVLPELTERAVPALIRAEVAQLEMRRMARHGAEKLGAEKLGAEKLGAEKLDAEKLGAEKSGAEKLEVFDMQASESVFS